MCFPKVFWEEPRNGVLFALKPIRSGTGVSVFSAENGAPHILTAAFPKYPSEVVMRILEEKDIYVSAGSACSRGKKSHVLKALKASDKLIGSAVRISLSRFSTIDEAQEFLDFAKEKLI